MPKPIISGVLGVVATALAATSALAAGPAGAPSIPTGQTVTINVPSSPNGYNQSWTLAYPGDNSNITVDAELGGLDPSFQTAAGFNVFDAPHQNTPVEIATLQSNQRQNDKNGIEFNYSSGTAGTVTIQFFSYAPQPITLDVTQGGLVSPGGTNGSVITPVTLVGPGGTPAAPASAAPAPGTPGAPAASGQSLPSGQTVTFNVPASPNGFSKAWRFTYPGDNSNIIFDSEINGLDPSFQTAVSYSVYDSQNGSTNPVEIATLQSNQKQNDPRGIEFVYSSGSAGTVTIRFSSYAPAALSVSLTQGGLVGPATSTGSVTTPVTLQPA